MFRRALLLPTRHNLKARMGDGNGFKITKTQIRALVSPFAKETMETDYGAGLEVFWGVPRETGLG